ncbi:uncharacterized protein LOC129748283 [Uranotaenia lowii]|uniref:uncharacterized protein LOC129746974 n=1 Tax=Uranotaenia lowii TaxID=190385 RepID=UPI00247A1585|nr:uncharacterized protein LOC129746974 [Uranotaenia lowii]XP_055598799.1 uncharacterized protein LOC129748283 [Uranotaenia lowii]
MVLEQNLKFRQKYYSILNGGIPDHNTQLEMVRIVCNDFFRDKMKNSYYPSTMEKADLAKAFLRAFPHLEVTRVELNAPAESAFFWHRKISDRRSLNQGHIERRITTMRKDVPFANRKFHRYIECIPEVSSSAQLAAELCASLEASAQNWAEISRHMRDAFPVLHKMVIEKKNFRHVISKFPHLKSFSGAMILQAFNHMHPACIPKMGMQRFLADSLLLDKTEYPMFKCVYIRACTMLLGTLKSRGCKRPAEDLDLPSRFIVAAPLIRWVEENNLAGYMMCQKDPHILCVGQHGDMGRFYIFLAPQEYIECGEDSLKVLEVFFKVFPVLGIPVPSLLRNLTVLVQNRVFGNCLPESSTVQKITKRFYEAGLARGDGL